LTTGDRLLFTDTSEARRTFNAPIRVGQTFSADIDGSVLDPTAPAFSIGNTFDLYGSNGTERFSLFTNNQYHNDHWTSTGDSDTGLPAASSFHIDFTLVTDDAYNLVLAPLGGGDPLFTQTNAPLSGARGAGIDSMRITAYGTGSSTDGSKEIFFNNLRVSGLAGDYNQDGSVDAADYVTWRETDGTMAGYNAWHANFGWPATENAASLSNLSVPEPPSSILLAMFLSTLFANKRKQRLCRY
jgi:hypothetical protein